MSTVGRHCHRGRRWCWWTPCHHRLAVAFAMVVVSQVVVVGATQWWVVQMAALSTPDVVVVMQMVSCSWAHRRVSMYQI